ncbi:MAG: Pr6Pr family membrane protein [Gemmatimonas sp.]
MLFAVLSFAAIGWQLVVHVQSGFSVLNFFSYFTNLSNLLAAIVLAIGAWWLSSRRAPSRTFDLLRLTTVTSMVVVGIVFSVLLRDVDLGALLPWVNVVLHYIMPVAVLAEWLIAPPGRLAAPQLIRCLLFPLTYLVYTLVRGAATSWYPYPFLTPAIAGGYGGVSMYVLAIVVLFIAAAWVLLKVSNGRAA